MPTTLLTPVEFGNARRAGATLWRKQLLPVGEINYDGRKISFTREYLAGLVKAFAEKAYPVVPFQFADRDNKHTMAPEQRRGTVKALELTDDGLDILVEAGAEATAHLEEYPDLGISASISEAYERADGRFWPAAVRHVLGTLDPRLPDLRPWEAVEAANDGGEVLDLSALDYAAPEVLAKPADAKQQQPASPPKEHTAMALSEAQEARLGKLLDLPEDQFNALLAPPADPAEGTEGDGDGTEDGELTDAELQQLMAEVEAETAAEGQEGAEPAEGEPALAGAQLSSEAQAAIDLANSRAEETSLQLARVRRQLDVTAYEAERDKLARVDGIPPRITDLARVLLEGEGRTVDLANGKNADAGAIVRRVLTEVGKTCKMLDLSAELGTSVDGGAEAEKAAEDQKVAERGELVSAVRQMTGI
jgi:hypothetical protein